MPHGKVGRAGKKLMRNAISRPKNRSQSRSQPTGRRGKVMAQRGAAKAGARRGASAKIGMARAGARRAASKQRRY